MELVKHTIIGLFRQCNAVHLELKVTRSIVVSAMPGPSTWVYSSCVVTKHVCPADTAHPPMTQVFFRKEKGWSLCLGCPWPGSRCRGGGAVQNGGGGEDAGWWGTSAVWEDSAGWEKQHWMGRAVWGQGGIAGVRRSLAVGTPGRLHSGSPGAELRTAGGRDGRRAARGGGVGGLGGTPSYVFCILPPPSFPPPFRSW